MGLDIPPVLVMVLVVVLVELLYLAVVVTGLVFAVLPVVATFPTIQYYISLCAYYFVYNCTVIVNLRTPT